MAARAHQENFKPTSTLEQERREVTDYVINSMRLEGVKLNQATLTNIEAFNRGDITKEEFLKRGLEIARAVEGEKK